MNEKEFIRIGRAVLERAEEAERALTAANGRIRELEAELRHEEQRIADLMGDVNRQGHQLTAEREVSDKLEKALREVIKLTQIPSSRRAGLQTAVTALAEIEAIRSKGEQA